MNNVVEALLKNTNFQISNESSVLSQRLRVRTPIEVINCLLGGGVPLGCVSQSYGPPKSGKSTWMYQTAGIFQKQYPNGIVAILDNESSADDSRLSWLGVDPKRVLRLPSSSIESGFLNLLQMLDNLSKVETKGEEIAVFVIWDTISKGLAQDNSTQSRMNAQDRARIIKNYMSPVLTKIEKHPFFLGLLNQVIYSTDRYGNTKMDAGGGVGLKHDVHFSTRVVLNERMDVYNGSFLVGRYSYIDIDKSKLSPEMSRIPIYIDVTNGGHIDEVKSFVDYLMAIEMLPQSSGWYKIDKTIGPQYATSIYYPLVQRLWKSWRYNDLVAYVQSDPLVYKFLRVALMDKFGEIYGLQKECMNDYRSELVNEILNEMGRYQTAVDRTPGLLTDDLLKLPDEQLKHLTSVIESVQSKDVVVCMDCGEVSEYHESCCKKCGSVRTLNAKYYVNELTNQPSESDKEESESVCEDSSDSSEVPESSES